MQDLPYRANPTQGTYATVVHHADDTGPTRQHELDHTDHTGLGINPRICLERSTADHELWEWMTCR